jgi:hypothetical protein
MQINDTLLVHHSIRTGIAGEDHNVSFHALIVGQGHHGTIHILQFEIGSLVAYFVPVNRNK